MNNINVPAMTEIRTKFGGICKVIHQDVSSAKIQFQNQMGEPITDIDMQGFAGDVGATFSVNVKTQKPVLYTNAEGMDKTLTTLHEMFNNVPGMIGLSHMQADQLQTNLSGSGTAFTKDSEEMNSTLTSLLRTASVGLTNQKIEILPVNVPYFSQYNHD